MKNLRIKYKDLWIKNVIGNTYDVFSLDGWENWSRVSFNKEREAVSVVSGANLSFLARRKISSLLRK